MNNIHLFRKLILHFIITISFFLIVLPVSRCDDDEDQFRNCVCPYSFWCASSPLNISYPFWGGERSESCGHEGFEIRCGNNGFHFIEIGTQKFRVLSINDSLPIMTIARENLLEDYCHGIETQHTVVNFSLFHYTPNAQELFHYTQNVQELSFFHNCSEAISPENPNYVSCTVGGVGKVTSFFLVGLPKHQLSNLTNTCQAEIKVPVPSTAVDDPTLTGKLVEVLSKGFEVEYYTDYTFCPACNWSGGTCKRDESNPGQYLCFCGDENKPQKSFTCPPGLGTRTVRKKLFLGISSALAGTTIICIIICLFKKKSVISTTVFRKRSKNERDLEAFFRNYGSLAPKRFSYSDVKKMTNSFKNKLGQGGYGDVFKGKLQDGQLVAVKLLNTSKGNGEDFINEVASISRTSHVNVVMLLGFCLEGKRRALIYEFMANGSLEQFIYSNDTSRTNQHLGWEKLYQIALGIARGLEYLHRGCNTRILHFDIKPHNILLDKDFCPKISDFGLAKLCPKNQSKVSMLDARGTIGYIAPEVFSRNFGEVSHKFDVYSYGMMILEMVGGRKNLHLGVENSSEIYFPQWVYRHLKQDNELKLLEGTTEEENEIAKKMIIVGLWCIQAHSLDRPSMNKVIDMLQGSIEALQIPSNPFLSSPQS